MLKADYIDYGTYNTST